jgi:glycosyltransferase involved in cell wall biosynthesis
VKKIIFVTNSTWNAYNFRKELIKDLAKDNYQVHIIAPIDDKASYFLKKKNIFLHDISLNTRSKNIFNDLKYMLILWRKFKEIKPDVVLNFVMKPLIYSSFVANTQNIPVVNTQTGLGTAYLNGGLFSWVTLLLYRIAYKNKSKKVLFHNKDDMDLFLEKNIVSKYQADTIPGSGIDLTKFSIKRKSDAPDTLIFLLVARIIKDKGVNEFLDSVELFFKHHKNLNIKFEIIGSFVEDGATNSHLRARVLDLNAKKVILYKDFTGDVTSQMAKADIIVMPSYREGTSRVLLEASALERPIITTDVPGCNNVVIDNVTGFLCKSKNSFDLYQKMIKMASLSDSERGLMGKEGRKHVTNCFSVEVVVEKYRSVISDIL